MNESDLQQAEKLAATVLRQGELRLQDQLARALASDQRATTLAALFTAAAMASLGFGISILEQQNPDWAVGMAAICTGTLLLVSILLCVIAAWPVTFAGVGAAPDNWWNDNVETRPLAECLRTESQNYQRRIDHNRAAHKAATRWLSAGILVGCSAPAAGLVAWALVAWA